MNGKYSHRDELEKRVKELQLTVAAERAKLEQLRVIHQAELRQARIDERSSVRWMPDEAKWIEAESRRLYELSATAGVRFDAQQGGSTNGLA